MSRILFPPIPEFVLNTRRIGVVTTLFPSAPQTCYPSSTMRLLIAAALLAATAAHAQLTPDTKAKINAIAEKVVHETGVPSASIGIVVDGKIAYTRAFGFARLQPSVPATAQIAYPIGSISKQFTATAVLLLQQEGKLKLSDPVSRFFPELTRANDVTLLNLLTMTSGYQDYAPQDYTIPAWKLPGDPLKTVRQFATKPLDFEPGTEWQYSNTNFVIAALIVEKVSGIPFAKFLHDRVLAPAGLQNVLNLNTDQSKLQLAGYMRNALAPLRPAVLEAPGWYMGDGDLAMPVGSLLQWDLTIINKTLLTQQSYRAFETPYLLQDGRNPQYGLGISVLMDKGHRILEHSGEVGGFVAENIVLPDEHIAVAVLTNQEASDAAGDIAREILPVLFALPKPPSAAPEDTFGPRLQTILAGLQKGKIDRSLFTPDCNDYFSADALADFQSSLGSLGAVSSVKAVRSRLRGGMKFTRYETAFTGGTSVVVSVYLMPDGKVEQLLIEGKV
ncbi:MAG TPA: serine hydrolase domain-containing protein [Acidobacteriaceae bacterium]|jgi:CubicO group peptidase (beta-lactamase class C family)